MPSEWGDRYWPLAALGTLALTGVTYIAYRYSSRAERARKRKLLKSERLRKIPLIRYPAEGKEADSDQGMKWVKRELITDEDGDTAHGFVEVR